LACGPGEEELAGDLGEALRVGEERGKGRKEKMTGGDSGSEREREGRRALGWAGRGPCGERREEGNGLLGREGAGPRGGGKESRPSCRVGLPSLLSSSFLFIFYTQTIQTNLFESK
jgi:hypothetical protein